MSWLCNTFTCVDAEKGDSEHTRVKRRDRPQRKKPLVHLVLFQEPQLDGDVVSHPLVLLSVHLEQLLGLLDLGQRVGIPRSKIQLLQISTVSVILNPVGE